MNVDKGLGIQGIIRGKIDLSSTIITDGWRGYDGLVDVGYDKHYRVNHGKNQFAYKGESEKWGWVSQQSLATTRSYSNCQWNRIILVIY